VVDVENSGKYGEDKSKPMKAYPFKLTEDDYDKLNKIKKHLNLDSNASTVRKLIRDYKLE